jgi:hypothetical protein
LRLALIGHWNLVRRQRVLSRVLFDFDYDRCAETMVATFGERAAFGQAKLRPCDKRAIWKAPIYMDEVAAAIRSKMVPDRS